MLYSAELDEYVKRKNVYEMNLAKAYALIFGYCSRTIQTRIETHPKFEEEIQDNPIELLKVIKIIMNDPEKSRYPYASLTEAMARIVNIKQHDRENLLDYSKRFKQAKDILKSHVGTNLLDGFIENLPEYRDSTSLQKSGTVKQDGALIIKK